MLKTATKPRHLKTAVLAVLLIAAFLWLGNWQWASAHNKASQKALAQAQQQKVVPLDELLKPQTEFPNDKSLRPVSVSGVYDQAKTQLVAGRVFNGQPGFWVMTPLVVDGTGARLPIVRGFVRQPGNLPKPPSGNVTLEGALAPGESVSQQTGLPEGQIGSIDMGLLLNEWGGTVYNAFIFSTKQTPATPSQPGTLTVQHVPPPTPQAHLELRNAAYAAQWWVFAVFTVFMWFKTVRDDWKDEHNDVHPDPA